MAEMIWCKRERKLEGFIVNVCIAAVFIVAAAMILGTIIVLTAISTGYMMPPVGASSHEALLVFGVLLTYLMTIIGVFGASDTPYKNIKWAMPSLLVLVIFTTLMSVTLFIGYSSLWGFAPVILGVFLIPYGYVHIKCMHEHYTKIKEELGREPTEEEATKYMADLKAKTSQ